MQSSSILCCSSNPFFASLHLLDSRGLAFFQGKDWLNSEPILHRFSKSSLSSLLKRSESRFTVKFSVTQELAETTSSTSSFVETGYIYGVHGLQGELRVKPSTDFPDLRFSQPGTRWLKQRSSGVETVKEIALLEGRGHRGQCWIVKLNDINTVEQAKKIVGSTIMVRDEDRPVLEEGEFYTRDLIGMKVILKESGEPVGTVVNVFNSGASDLLHVKLSSSRNSRANDLVWVPFVEAIVPIVDLEKGEMSITPPKGLLELNTRSGVGSKKERRDLEWREKKKIQRRVIAAKKKLLDMEQQHVFHGFRHGEKAEKRLLANQIATVNLKLLHQALQSIEKPSTRLNLHDILSTVPRSNTLKVSDSPSSDPYSKLQTEGSVLISNGRATIVLVSGETEEAFDANLVHSAGHENECLRIKAYLEEDHRFAKIEDRNVVPIVLVGSSGSTSCLQKLFLDHDYFAFDPKKVWFLEETKLPLVSCTAVGVHKILMKSPWEILQRRVGSGGLISLFSSQEPLLDQLMQIGVEYIEVCSTNRTHEDGSALLGLVDSRRANVGIRLIEGLSSEDDFGVVFSASFLRKLTKRMNELGFEAVLGCNPHVERGGEEWVDVVPTAPNSYEFQSSIYSSLNATTVDRVCVLELGFGGLNR